MFGGVIESDGVIEMGSAFREFSFKRQGNAHDAMRYEQWRCCPLLLGEREELCRKIAHGPPVRRDIVLRKKTI